MKLDFGAAGSNRLQEEIQSMSSTAITTLVRMMEMLPDDTQDRVVERVRSYVADVQDEQRWDSAFQRTQTQLIAAARRARQEIAAGQAEPLDHRRL